MIILVMVGVGVLQSVSVECRSLGAKLHTSKCATDDIRSATIFGFDGIDQTRARGAYGERWCSFSNATPHTRSVVRSHQNRATVLGVDLAHKSITQYSIIRNWEHTHLAMLIPSVYAIFPTPPNWTQTCSIELWCTAGVGWRKKHTHILIRFLQQIQLIRNLIADFWTINERVSFIWRATWHPFNAQ